jgi:hypothetical protein
MELSPSWEAANCAATQELSCILWNPKVHCCVHKRPLLIHILSHINPVHTTPLLSLNGKSTLRKVSGQHSHRRTQKCIHIPNGILTHDPSVGAAEENTYSRPRDHCDRRAEFFFISLQWIAGFHSYQDLHSSANPFTCPPPPHLISLAESPEN